MPISMSAMGHFSPCRNGIGLDGRRRRKLLANRFRYTGVAAGVVHDQTCEGQTILQLRVEALAEGGHEQLDEDSRCRPPHGVARQLEEPDREGPVRIEGGEADAGLRGF